MTKINKKTGFVEPKHKYYKIVGVKTSKEFHKKYGTIMLKLNKCLEIFFEKKFQEEKAKLIKSGLNQEEVIKKSVLLNEAKQMLINWENEDTETRNLWEKMNNWVYQGFNQTYTDLGVSFDKNYYESQTFLLGKKIVKNCLKGESIQTDDLVL